MSTATVPSGRLTRIVRGRQQTGWIGVDIGSSAIKVAHTVREGSRWTLRESRLLPLDDHLRPDGDSLPSTEMSTLLRTALTGRRSRSTTAAATLPMSVVDLRSLELPPGTVEELRQMIGVELNPEDDPERHCEFDFWEQPCEGGQKETRQYSVLSLPTRSATGLSDMLSAAGLTCHVIDTLPCALARAVTLVERPAPGQTVAALDWGYRTPMFVLIRNGKPIFARTLKNCGGELIVEQVSSQLKVPAADVHELLLTCARTSDLTDGRAGLEDLLTTSAVGARKRMAEELVRTFGYLRNQPGGLAPQRMWLFGCVSLLPDTADLLTQSCGLEARVWNLNATCDDSTQPADAMHALLGPAIGLSTLGGSVG
ncbi:MAG: pilus assembly protein PilM [Maioricimonas sp. JB045]